MRTRGIMTQGSFSDNFCKILANLSPLLYFPSVSDRWFGGGGGGCRGRVVFVLYLSLCKTDSYKGICGTCYSSTPKNDCFLNKVAYLCKQRTESPISLYSHPTYNLTPTPLSKRRGGVNKKISPKMFRS